LYHSTDKGLNWNVYSTPVADFGGAVTAGTSANFSFSSSTDGLIVTNAGAVYKTTNSGANWTLLTTTGTVLTNGLCYIEGTNTAFTTGAGAGTSGSSYSEDGGVTWNIIDTEAHLYVEFTNPSVGWSGWFNQTAVLDGMWKWNDLSTSLVGDFSASAITTCTASPVTFTDQTTGGTPTSWTWSFPGGTPSTSIVQNPSITFPTAGTYDVTLTVSDGNSQTTVTQTAFITAIAPAAVPSSITGATAVCDSAVETYSVVNDPNVVYNWTTPAGWIGTSTTNTFTVTAVLPGGSIEVNAEIICGTTANSTLAVAVGTGAPTAAFTSSNTIYDYSFTSTSTNAGTWSWDFGDGMGTSTQENPLYTYTTNGTFTVTLTVDSGCGTDTFTSQVTISGIGLEENQLDVVQLFPNPASETVHIQVSNDMIGENYSITDLAGKELMSGTLSDVTSVKIDTLASGVYFVLAGNASAVKFVKE
jgi:PKD repeat protein